MNDIIALFAPIKERKIIKEWHAKLKIQHMPPSWRRERHFAFMRLFTSYFIAIVLSFGISVSFSETSENILKLNWGDTLSNCNSIYNLMPVSENPYLIKSLKRFIDIKDRKAFSEYHVENSDKVKVCEGPINFHTFLGFYHNKLVYIWFSTNEMHYNKDTALFFTGKYQKELVDSCFDKIRILNKSYTDDITITGDEGFASYGSCKGCYNVFQTNLGDMAKPNYIQLVFYQFDKSFFDQYTVSKHYLMPIVLKKEFNAYKVFCCYYSPKTIKLFLNQYNQK